MLPRRLLRFTAQRKMTMDFYTSRMLPKKCLVRSKLLAYHNYVTLECIPPPLSVIATADQVLHSINCKLKLSQYEAHFFLCVNKSGYIVPDVILVRHFLSKCVYNIWHINVYCCDCSVIMISMQCCIVLCRSTMHSHSVEPSGSRTKPLTILILSQGRTMPLIS